MHSHQSSAFSHGSFTTMEVLKLTFKKSGFMPKRDLLRNGTLTQNFHLMPLFLTSVFTNASVPFSHAQPLRESFPQSSIKN